MRHFRLLALLAPVLLLPAACEDSGSSPVAATPFEAGSDFEAGPESDASVPPPVDAALPDGAKPAAGVTVTVRAGSAAKANVRVIAHDASGSVTGDLVTDATGKVLFANAPSMVTVLSKTANGEGDDDDALTVLGVTDGDNLTVALSTAFAIDPVVLGSYAVNLKPPYLAGEGLVYSVSLGAQCGNITSDPSLPVNVPAYDYCVNASNALLASVLGPTNTVGFGFVKNVAKPTLNGTTSVDIGTFLAKGATKLTATNLPPLGSRAAALAAIANGVAFDTGAGTGDFAEGGVTFDTATGFAEAYQSHVTLATNEADGSTRKRALFRREATTAPASATLSNIDFAALLPTIAASVTATALRPDVALTSPSAAAIAATDGGAVSLTWYSATNVRSSWTFLVPPATTAFKVPALPTSAAEFAPSAEVVIGNAVFGESTLVPGYAQLKALPLTPGSFVTLFDEQRALPSDGTVRVTSWEQTPN